MNRKTAVKAKAKKSNDVEELIDKEVITVVDRSKSYYQPTDKEIDWSMSAKDALQVNYLTRTNKSALH